MVKPVVFASLILDMARWQQACEQVERLRDATKAASSVTKASGKPSPVRPQGRKRGPVAAKASPGENPARSLRKRPLPAKSHDLDEDETESLESSSSPPPSKRSRRRRSRTNSERTRDASETPSKNPSALRFLPPNQVLSTSAHMADEGRRHWRRKSTISVTQKKTLDRGVTSRNRAGLPFQPVTWNCGCQRTVRWYFNTQSTRFRLP